MAISLAKGQKISLEKVAADAGIQGGLQKILVGLGWDPIKYTSDNGFDLDASVFMCDGSGKVAKESNFIFYNNKTAPGVEHMGDNRTGDGDGAWDSLQRVVFLYSEDGGRCDCVSYRLYGRGRFRGVCYS